MNKELSREELISWLESAEGQRWSKSFHKTSGNQTDLMSIKEADQFEVKQPIWKCAITISTVLEGWV